MRRTPDDEARRRRINATDPTASRGHRKNASGHGFVAEADLAKRLGGRTTAGSGSQADKGDINLTDIKVEVKSTKYRQITLKLDWLIRIKEQAVRVGMQAALAIQFVNSKGKIVKNGSWVMMQERDYLHYLELLQREENEGRDP